MNRGTYRADASTIVARIPEHHFPAELRHDRELRAAFIRGVLDGALGELEETQQTPTDRALTERRAYLTGYSYGCDHERELRP